jgi:DNA-binding response OmpR family regulator
LSSKKSILCVNENSDTCFLISNLLRQFDYEITTASGVDDAQSLIRTGWFDLYVLGKKYNDNSTIDLCRWIREHDSSAPVVFYAGDTSQSSRREALAAGAAGYILEPYLNELLEAINGRLGRIIAAKG